MDKIDKGESGGLLAPDWNPPGVDTQQAHPARIYDFLIGGKDHFPVDRQAAETALQTMPELRAMARANRVLVVGDEVQDGHHQHGQRLVEVQDGAHGRAVHDRLGLADVGVQDSGALGVAVGEQHPAVGDDGRVVVRVDEAGLRADRPRDVGDAAGAGDARADVEELLDPGLGEETHGAAEERPGGIVAKLTETLAAGSAIALSHAGSGSEPSAAPEPARFAAARQAWDGARSPLVARTREEIVRFFDGTQLVEPGVVTLPQWRPDHPVGDEERFLSFGFCGVGFKT